MNFQNELKEATQNMSAETATRLADKMRASISSRELNSVCACGTPCRDYIIHDAIDHLTLMELEGVIKTG